MGNEEEHMDTPSVQNITLSLDEQEAAQLAHAVHKLVQELGFPPEDVNRSFNDSFAYFIKTAEDSAFRSPVS
jgi:hypothetical protein